GSVAEEAPSQTAARAARVRRGVREDPEARGAAARCDGLGALRGAHGRSAGRGAGLRAGFTPRGRRRSARIPPADEIRAPRRAARARGAGSLLQARAGREVGGAAGAPRGRQALPRAGRTCARAAASATSTDGMPIAAVHAKKTPYAVISSMLRSSVSTATPEKPFSTLPRIA